MDARAKRGHDEGGKSLLTKTMGHRNRVYPISAFEVRKSPRTLNNPVIGYYALDLSEANKGKPLEPVRISLSPDKKTVIVEQYTRGLPPTRIPVAWRHGRF